MTASIPKLTARLRFLEADCRSHAAICDPGPNARHVALNVRHREERDEILQRLAEVVPDCFDDAMALLEFAAWQMKSAAPLDDKWPTIAILKKCADGFMKAHVKLRVDHPLHRFEERQDQGRRMIATLRIRYRVLNLCALMFVLRRLMARAERLSRPER